MAVEILQEGFPAIPSPDEHRYTFADAEATRVYMRDLVRALTSQFNFQKTDADKLNAAIVPFTSPLTTKGDLYAYSTLDARFPVGTNNHFIVADSAQALGIKYRALLAADLPVGSILQVTSMSLDTFPTNTGTSFADITGLTHSITPTSASNKVLILYNIAGANGTDHTTVRMVRDSTAINNGAASGSRSQGLGIDFYVVNANQTMTVSGSYLDSPATTSSVAYKFQARMDSGTFRLNTSGNDTDGTYTTVASSTITLMEIKG